MQNFIYKIKSFLGLVEKKHEHYYKFHHREVDCYDEDMDLLPSGLFNVVFRFKCSCGAKKSSERMITSVPYSSIFLEEIEKKINY